MPAWGDPFPCRPGNTQEGAPAWTPAGARRIFGRASRTRVPGQTWGHLSHKCRLVHSGGRPALFVPGGTTAAAPFHPHGCGQRKCLVAQRKIPVVHSWGPALLLRLWFCKDIQGRTRNNRDRSRASLRMNHVGRFEGVSMPMRIPGVRPCVHPAHGWAWKGRRRVNEGNSRGAAAPAVTGLLRALAGSPGSLRMGGSAPLACVGRACRPTGMLFSAREAYGSGSLPARSRAAAG